MAVLPQAPVRARISARRAACESQPPLADAAARPVRAPAEPSALARRILVFGTPRPEPLLLPPPSSLLTVAQARRFFFDTPRFS